MSATELLNAETICAGLDAVARAHLSHVEILAEVDSTNSYLLEKSKLPSGYICLAEQQTAARGRRDKYWHAPPGENIYLSLCWQFENLQKIAGLSLVSGIAVADALVKYGLADIKLKWPNDIYFEQQKLGGILVEINKELNGNYRAVIGIGINVALPQDTAVINQPWTDIVTLTQRPAERNLLIGFLLNALLDLLPQFQHTGLAPFLARWQHYDMLFNQPILIHQQPHPSAGIAAGIDGEGNLLVDIDGVIKAVFSGEVSVRLQGTKFNI